MDSKCKKHPKYLACYAPRVDCLPCWKIYALKTKERNNKLLNMHVGRRGKLK